LPRLSRLRRRRQIGLGEGRLKYMPLPRIGLQPEGSLRGRLHKARNLTLVTICRRQVLVSLERGQGQQEISGGLDRLGLRCASVGGEPLQ
jgi:hypothetical protein